MKLVFGNWRCLQRGFSFTLIELLVVIAIISMLAALLTPALKGAKLKANDIKCGQNERQIHLAVVMYCHDHDNRYMNNIGPNSQYNQLVVFSNYVQNKLDFFRCPLSYDDVRNGAPNLCKDRADYSTNINGKLEWTEYKLNDYQSGWGGGPVDKDFGSQVRPQMMVIVIDGNFDWPRHRGKSNLCFFDGHVEMVTYNQYMVNGEPGSPTGWPKEWWGWGIDPY